ncbi:hypothetical protein K438DRAFT_1987135 [Mycena galopus ATCC 62051]|nr:hypothetical protein K438DRAFT_1987135 [Mycena galopus ATCC 62051]
MPGRHSSLYFEDGTLTLKAGDGTLYNVYRAPLVLRSEFFKGMLTLPVSNLPPPSRNESAPGYIAKAKAQGLDGTGDDTAVEIPAQFSSFEIEKFLEFIFLQGWSTTVPDLATACAILRLSHFFVVDTGINFARHHLDTHEGLSAFSRLKLGFNYHIKPWIAKAFDDLMATPINKITAEEEEEMGWTAYRALAKAQASVLDHRLTLASNPPIPNHCNWCSNHAYCAKAWNEMWTSIPNGVLGALVRDKLAGAVILEQLPTYPVGTMNSECHRRTLEGLKDTVEGLSDFRLPVEEDLIDAAVTALIKDKGIA